MIGFSGIGVQVQSTLSELLRRPAVDLTLIGDSSKLRPIFPEFQGKIVDSKLPIYSIREQIAFPGPEAGAILHIPHYAAPVRFLSRSVVMVHDLIHLQSDEFAAPHFRMYARFLLGRVAAKAKAIITVSNYTRDCLVSEFPKAADKTTVIHNGIDHSVFFPAEGKEIFEFRQRYHLPEQYLLCVGIGKRHKNVDFLIRALSLLWKNQSLALPLVIGGTGGSLPDYVADEVKKQNVQNHILTIPALEPAEMRALYSAATALIMPSLLEGFGFPVVEAMACGTPVLSSNRTSLAEIGETAAYFFDPVNEDDLRSKLTELLKRSAFAERMAMRGVAQASRFTWAEHVDLLLAVYRRLSV